MVSLFFTNFFKAHAYYYHKLEVLVVEIVVVVLINFGLALIKIRYHTVGGLTSSGADFSHFLIKVEMTCFRLLEPFVCEARRDFQLV